MYNCSECLKKPCKRQTLEGAPVNCPTRGCDISESLDRYSEEEIKTAVIAAKVEAAGYGKWPRIYEIMQYCWGLGYKKIGLGFCVGLSEEAKAVAKVFRSNGFEVESVGCKNGSVPKQNIGLKDSELVNKGSGPECMCNPAAQAELLDEAGCDINVIIGLCVGHDTLFIKHSKAPVTVLAVKDRSNGHNPLSCIYTLDSYNSWLYKADNMFKK